MSGIKNKYIIEGNIVKILLESKYGNRYTILDLDDFNNKIKGIDAKWCLRSGEDLYAQRTYYLGVIDGVQRNNTQNLHFLIIDCPKGMFIDHINHDTLDNRKENLRIVSCEENTQYRKGANKNNKTGYRNIIFLEKDNAYRVQLMKNYKRYTWSFSANKYSLDDMVQFAKEKRQELFGEFAGEG